MHCDTCHNSVFFVFLGGSSLILGWQQTHTVLKHVQWIAQILHGPVMIIVKFVDSLVGQVTNSVFYCRTLALWTHFLEFWLDFNVVIEVSYVVNVVVA
jgi:hypothetical protein